MPPLLLRPLALATSLVAVVLLSRPPEALAGRSDAPLLPPARLFRAVAAPYLSLVADYYWLQTLNQVGGAQSAEESRHIFPYADLATELDPRFAAVYTFAGVAIPWQVGRERWVNTEESTRLLRKGAAALPDHYGIRFQLAYNLIFFHKQYREAADLLHALARHPEAPPYLPALATRLLGASGDFETGVAMAATLRDAAEDEETRAFYEQRILELHQERMLRELDAAIGRFRAREGRLPARLEELVTRGDVKRLPEDPLGGTLGLDAKGRAVSSARAKRLRVYEMSEMGAKAP
jgi:hypothetical protein